MRRKNSMNNLAVCVDNKNQNVTAKQTIDAIFFNIMILGNWLDIKY